jgi:transcriptional regulator with XRE-family HTH domain
MSNTTDLILKSLGERLRAERIARGWSQQRLARALPEAPSRQTIARMERGDPRVDFGLWLSLAEALGLAHTFSGGLKSEGDLFVLADARRRQRARRQG